MRSQDIWTAVSKVDHSRWTAPPVHSATGCVEPGKMWFPSGDAGNSVRRKGITQDSKTAGNKRRAVVTGAANGLGLAIARRLSAGGAHVLLVDSDRTVLSTIGEIDFPP